MEEIVVVFLCIAKVIVGAKLVTGVLTNCKFTRLVVEKYQ